MSDKKKALSRRYSGTPVAARKSAPQDICQQQSSSSSLVCDSATYSDSRQSTTPGASTGSGLRNEEYDRRVHRRDSMRNEVIQNKPVMERNLVAADNLVTPTPVVAQKRRRYVPMGDGIGNQFNKDGVMGR
ncbi:hypothetical protein BGW38_006016 [Lunasporangiospora selenospora]|uniref:Uncharacterized protein n=1 Tax=Lunasporangiospora selenospora TaxID=979761 RepID=A0A9P6G005_9FUNG|nr:hypothetical protein BGW38_006016 [Lunasporangiospora selenospora]